jgi:hypothetical protein
MKGVTISYCVVRHPEQRQAALISGVDIADAAKHRATSEQQPHPRTKHKKQRRTTPYLTGSEWRMFVMKKTL